MKKHAPAAPIPWLRNAVMNPGALAAIQQAKPSGIDCAHLCLSEWNPRIRRSGHWRDLGLQLTRLFLDAGLPWPTIKAEVPVGGEPGSFIYRWLTETLQSILPRIEEYGLKSADKLQIDTLVTRMEAEARLRQTQLIGPLQFGAWAKNRN
jgi:hypothetical protein